MADCENIKISMCGDRGLKMPESSCDSIRFVGTDDVTINQGVCIDLTDGVHAYDGNGQEIEYTVKPSEIGCCDVGEHEVTYTAVGEGSKMLPSFCLGKPMLHLKACGLATAVVKRLVTITQALPPKILGIARTILPIGTTFDPMDGVSGVDDNGNQTEVTFSGRYDYGTEKADIVTIDSDVEQDLRSVKVTLEPIQSGSGTPSPDNIRPISGRTEVVTQRTGKNLLPKFSVSDFDNGVVYGLSTYILIPLKAGTYIISNNAPTGYIWAGIDFNTGQSYTRVFAGKPKTITVSEDTDLMYGILTTDKATALSYDAQIELGSTATAYEPYQGNTYHTDLGRTVYGGTLDVVSGELVVDSVMMVLDGSENWIARGIGAKSYYCIKVGDNNSVVQSSILSDKYAQADVRDATESVGINLVNSTANNGAFIYIRPNNVTDMTLASFKDWIAENTLQVVYELVAPQTIQLTPQEVRTLLGTNNVWSEDGKVQVVYSKPLEEGSSKFDYDGVYPITYHTEDSCGNETTETRYIIVGDGIIVDDTYSVACQGKVCYSILECDDIETFRTVIYDDGTLIINESSNDKDNNIARHGEAKYVYPPLNSEGNNYAWTSEPWNVMWHTSDTRYYIKSIEIGSRIRPTSIAYWFYHLDYCKSIDLTNLDTSRCTSMERAFSYVGYGVSTQDAVPYLDLSMFDTSNVTNMRYMFNHIYGAKVIDASSWAVAPTVDTHSIFSYCDLTETIYASPSFQAPTETDYGYFLGCTKLVGGAGTRYADQGYEDSYSTYARIDNPPDAKGYFAAK